MTFLDQSIRQIDQAEVAKIFHQLKPVTNETLIGEWDAHVFPSDSDHPRHGLAEALLPSGKTFYSADHAQKVAIRDGKRKRQEFWGDVFTAQAEFKGVVSTAIIYDDHPMIEYFRYVDDHTVAGANWYKKLKDAGIYYFYMTRTGNLKD
ncbi:hypothetical protein AWENTII_012123 [Aspergillus wentii]